MTSTIQIHQHPTSGESYAVLVDDAGTFLRAAGPMEQDATLESAEGWLDNAFNPEAEDDAEWLAAEIEKATNGR